MAQGSGIREVAWLDIAGGGQVVTDGGYAYVGHMTQPHGTSVIDVRDPKKPKIVASIDIPPGAQWSGLVGAYVNGTAGNYPHNANLGGKAEFDWASSGLKCRLHVPLNPMVAAAQPEPRRLKKRA